MKRLLILLVTVSIPLMCLQTNYVSDAVETTNKADITFWYGEDVCERLINEGINSLIFYVDDEIIGSTSAYVYFEKKPDCGDMGSISITYYVNKIVYKPYKIIDENDNLIWKGYVKIVPGTCMKYELVLKD